MPMVNMIEHGFTLKPWNFFDANPTMDLPHYLRINPGETDREGVEDYPTVDKCEPKTQDIDHFFSGA
jgi:hypothetical protein